MKRFRKLDCLFISALRDDLVQIVNIVYSEEFVPFGLLQERLIKLFLVVVFRYSVRLALQREAHEDALAVFPQFEILYVLRRRCHIAVEKVSRTLEFVELDMLQRRRALHEPEPFGVSVLFEIFDCGPARYDLFLKRIVPGDEFTHACFDLSDPALRNLYGLLWVPGISDLRVQALIQRVHYLDSRVRHHVLDRLDKYEAETRLVDQVGRLCAHVEELDAARLYDLSAQFHEVVVHQSSQYGVRQIARERDEIFHTGTALDFDFPDILFRSADEFYFQNVPPAGGRPDAVKREGSGTADAGFGRLSVSGSGFGRLQVSCSGFGRLPASGSGFGRLVAVCQVEVDHDPHILLAQRDAAAHVLVIRIPVPDVVLRAEVVPLHDVQFFSPARIVPADYSYVPYDLECDFSVCFFRHNGSPSQGISSSSFKKDLPFLPYIVNR